MKSFIALSILVCCLAASAAAQPQGRRPGNLDSCRATRLMDKESLYFVIGEGQECADNIPQDLENDIRAGAPSDQCADLGASANLRVCIVNFREVARVLRESGANGDARRRDEFGRRDDEERPGRRGPPGDRPVRRGPPEERPGRPLIDFSLVDKTLLELNDRNVRGHCFVCPA